MSNFTGGNPARGANKAHRNAMFRNPTSFGNAVLPHGALSFLMCNGNMRGAVHDGKTAGGVAHWPLFNPTSDFTALYEIVDGTAPLGTDIDGDGDSDAIDPAVLAAGILALPPTDLASLAAALISADAPNALGVSLVDGLLVATDT